MTAPRRRVEELDVDACLQLLEGHQVGRLAFVDADGGPVVLPVNYVLDRGVVVIRTAEGSKLAAAVAKARVAFEVDEFDKDLRIGWSVLVKGTADELWQSPELDLARRLPLQAWAPGEREHYILIMSTAMTGRRITTLEGPALPPRATDLWFG
jgi:nitroimidazol reductase NimA-like FMN-containing flavoprotein (pyridoxamine 5'-phosphate oxidase superfamily)